MWYVMIVVGSKRIRSSASQLRSRHEGFGRRVDQRTAFRSKDRNKAQVCRKWGKSCRYSLQEVFQCIWRNYGRRRRLTFQLVRQRVRRKISFWDNSVARRR